jgi:hypothetical protein
VTKVFQVYPDRQAMLMTAFQVLRVQQVTKETRGWPASEVAMDCLDYQDRKVSWVELVRLVCLASMVRKVRGVRVGYQDSKVIEVFQATWDQQEFWETTANRDFLDFQELQVQLVSLERLE